MTQELDRLEADALRLVEAVGGWPPIVVDSRQATEIFAHLEELRARVAALRTREADSLTTKLVLAKLAFLYGLVSGGFRVQCEKLLQEILATRPTCAQAHLLLGLLYLEMSDLEASAAEEHLRRAAAGSDAASPLAHQGLVIACVLLGRPAEAAEHLDRYTRAGGRRQDLRQAIDARMRGDAPRFRDDTPLLLTAAMSGRMSIQPDFFVKPLRVAFLPDFVLNLIVIFGLLGLLFVGIVLYTYFFLN